MTCGPLPGFLDPALPRSIFHESSEQNPLLPPRTCIFRAVSGHYKLLLRISTRSVDANHVLVK